MCESTISFSQCDKHLLLTSSKTEYLTAGMSTERVVEEKSTIEITPTEVLIKPGNEPHEMRGLIKSQSCNWTVPFKEGRSVIKATLTDENGEVKNLTLTLEGKEGKVTFLAEVAEMPDRKIRVAIDSFEEKK